MSVGYLADSFDLINVRDLDLIAQAYAQCSRLVLGVFTDEYAERVFGRRPVVPLAERIALLRHVRGVADAVPHSEDVEPILAAVEVVLFVAADVPVQVIEDPVVLTPRRHTESPVLRSALLAADLQDVDGGIDGEAVA
jgi:bifunctional ADP-heptose synthase (sugar kinase/adenylyltransferase)